MPPIRLPLEVQEHIITVGRDDRAFLLLCTLVCSDWVPCSRSLLALEIKLQTALDYEKAIGVIAAPAKTTLRQSIRSIHFEDLQSPHRIDPAVLATTIYALSSIPLIHALTIVDSELTDRETASLLAGAFPNVRFMTVHLFESDVSVLKDFISRFRQLEFLETKVDLFTDWVQGVALDPFPPLYSTLPSSLRELSLPESFAETDKQPQAHEAFIMWIEEALTSSILALTLQFSPYRWNLAVRFLESLRRRCEVKTLSLIFSDHLVKDHFARSPSNDFTAVLCAATSIIVRWPSEEEIEYVIPRCVGIPSGLECVRLLDIEPGFALSSRGRWENLFSGFASAPRLKKVDMTWEDGPLNDLGEALRLALLSLEGTAVEVYFNGEVSPWAHGVNGACSGST